MVGAATVLVPVFPANAEERALLAQGMARGKWVATLLARLASLAQPVVVAGFMQELRSACAAQGLEYLAVAGVPEDIGHAPRGALLCLRQLLAAGQMEPHAPVVLFDYRYPLALARLGGLAEMAGKDPLPLRIGAVCPADHPIQFERAYRLAVTEVVRMFEADPASHGGSAPSARKDERESGPFSILNRDLAGLPDGEAVCFPSAGFRHRIVPARNLGEFDAAAEGVRIRVESGRIRRLDNSRNIGPTPVRIVGEPSLRPLRGAPFLAVAGPHGNEARLLVRSTYVQPGVLIKVWPSRDGGFSAPLAPAARGWLGDGAVVQIAGHRYAEVGTGHALPQGVGSFLVAAMLPAGEGEAAEWRERVAPEVPLWGEAEGGAVGPDGAPITCSQQFPPVIELCGAVAAGTASRLLDFQPEEAEPVILGREEALRMDTRIAALLLEELLERGERS